VKSQQLNVSANIQERGYIRVQKIPNRCSNEPFRQSLIDDADGKIKGQANRQAFRKDRSKQTFALRLIAEKAR